MKIFGKIYIFCELSIFHHNLDHLSKIRRITLSQNIGRLILIGQLVQFPLPDQMHVISRLRKVKQCFMQMILLYIGVRFT
jgi:hypothetical protein